MTLDISPVGWWSTVVVAALVVTVIVLVIMLAGKASKMTIGVTSGVFVMLLAGTIITTLMQVQVEDEYLMYGGSQDSLMEEVLADDDTVTQLSDTLYVQQRIGFSIHDCRPIIIGSEDFTHTVGVECLTTNDTVERITK